MSKDDKEHSDPVSLEGRKPLALQSGRLSLIGIDS